MGDVRFVPRSFKIPQTARTGDTVELEVEIDNTNDLDWEDFIIVWSLYSDSKGTDLWGRGSKQDHLWGWPGEVGGYTSEATFTMPAMDVWLMIELYRLHDGDKTKADSTGLVKIDNPADGDEKEKWWWLRYEILGVPAWAYMTVGSAATVGAVMIEK